MLEESKLPEVSSSISERKLAIDALRLRSVSVSHGTLRAQDLIPCFMDYIYKYNHDAWEIIINDIKLSWETFNQDYAFSEMMCDVMGLDGYRMGLSLDDDDSWWISEDASTILNEDIWDAMDELAPPGTSFGAHEGDGSDFGFWPNEDSESNPKEVEIREAADLMASKSQRLERSEVDEVRHLIKLQEQAEELPVLGQLNYGSSGSGKSSGPTDPIRSKPLTPTDFLQIDRTSENIYWKDAIDRSQHPITRKAEGSFWMCGGKVVYWHGQEAEEANRILSKLEKTP